jgi:uncharacterized glyoxalase superfamily metalloenzyme YdcJ
VPQKIIFSEASEQICKSPFRVIASLERIDTIDQSVISKEHRQDIITLVGDKLLIQH